MGHHRHTLEHFRPLFWERFICLNNALVLVTCEGTGAGRGFCFQRGCEFVRQILPQESAGQARSACLSHLKHRRIPVPVVALRASHSPRPARLSCLSECPECHLGSIVTLAESTPLRLCFTSDKSIAPNPPVLARAGSALGFGPTRPGSFLCVSWVYFTKDAG